MGQMEAGTRWDKGRTRQEQGPDGRGRGRPDGSRGQMVAGGLCLLPIAPSGVPSPFWYPIPYLVPYPLSGILPKIGVPPHNESPKWNSLLLDI